MYYRHMLSFVEIVCFFLSDGWAERICVEWFNNICSTNISKSRFCSPICVNQSPLISSSPNPTIYITISVWIVLLSCQKPPVFSYHLSRLHHTETSRVAELSLYIKGNNLMVGNSTNTLLFYGEMPYRARFSRNANITPVSLLSLATVMVNLKFANARQNGGHFFWFSSPKSI